MIKISDSFQPKSCSSAKKNSSYIIYYQVVLFFVTIFTASFSTLAQSNINYNDSSNWMCHPVLKSTDVARQHDLNLYMISKDSLVVGTINPVTNPDTLVDIFYIYPTIAMEYILGNVKMDEIDRPVAEFVFREQAGIYAQFGRVFAPYYRQAKIGVFTDTTNTEQVKSILAEHMDTAYKDIEAAFDNYLENYNNGHKIILIGHSQGSDMMRFLLCRRFDNNTVLKSQLVVALSGGEPNYASSDGSRTGGSLQHIKSLESDSVIESGCIISWRSWKAGTPGAALAPCSFYYNHFFIDKGLLYQTYDTTKHQESNFDFGYSTDKMVTTYVTLAPDSSVYWGFDDMFGAHFVSDTIKPGCTYLMIDSIPIPNDKREIKNTLETTNPLYPLFPSIPIPYNTYFLNPSSVNTNYHCWDMQFVQGDLLNLLPQLIAITNPITSIPKFTYVENKILIYPNPSTDIVHISNLNSNIESIKLYNLQGMLIREFLGNDFPVSDLSTGIYYINIQTDKSTFTSKLVKR
jgi:hypothetical protein